MIERKDIKTFIEADYYEGTTIEHKAIELSRLRCELQELMKEADSQWLKVLIHKRFGLLLEDKK